MTATGPDHAGHEDVAAFVAKWRAREPEMAFAEVFCPRGLRDRFGLWGALVLAWREAALELSDARPTHAKCGWWAEEAVRCAQGEPRHPLTIALAMPSLPWLTLARAMSAMADEEPSRPVDREAALASVAPLANALVAIEAALFEAPASDAARRATAVHLLGERLRIGRETGDGGRVPLSLLARHGIVAANLGGAKGEPVLRDWAAELAATLPAGRIDACLFRRARMDFDAWLLRDGAAGRRRNLPPLHALFRAWRSARRGRPG